MQLRDGQDRWSGTKCSTSIILMDCAKQVVTCENILRESKYNMIMQVPRSHSQVNYQPASHFSLLERSCHVWILIVLDFAASNLSKISLLVIVVFLLCFVFNTFLVLLSSLSQISLFAGAWNLTLLLRRHHEILKCLSRWLKSLIPGPVFLIVVVVVILVVLDVHFYLFHTYPITNPQFRD